MTRILLQLGAFIGTILFTLSSCNIKLDRYSDKEKGNGKIIKQEFPISDYNRINLSAVHDIIYQQKNSDTPYLEMEIDSNLLQYIKVEVINGELNIYMDKEGKKPKPTKFIVYTNSKSLNRVDVSGVGKFVAKETVKTDSIFLNLGGVGDIIFDNLEANYTNAQFNGVGGMKLAGTSNSSEFVSSGVGDINSVDLIQKEATCTLSGVGNVKVNASDKLVASSSGVGSIEYKGNPTLTASNSGIGKIKQIN